MDHFSVLNYQGSKKNLLEFIHSNASSYITPNSTILDIFSGTCSVGYSYKRDYCVYANDSEYYAYVISTALLGSYTEDPTIIIKQIEDDYLENTAGFHPDILKKQKEEDDLLKKTDNISQLIEFYNSIPTVWNGKVSFTLGMHKNYELFTTYFSNSYFGLKQSMDIDSIRYAIDKFKLSHLFYPLLTALFFAMKECVFSKDGHMAQPLNLLENKNKLFLVRNKSVFDIFKQKFLNLRLYFLSYKNFLIFDPKEPSLMTCS